MINQGWGQAAIHGLAEGMNIHTQAKDRSHADDPSQTNSFWVEDLEGLNLYGLYRPALDKIQELDQRIKVLSQCIAREVEENQALSEKIESLENDRRFLLRALEKVANRGVWFAQLVFSELPSQLRTELLPLVHYLVRPYVQPVVDALEHTQTNKPIPDTKATGADKPKMKIRSVDQLLQAWQERGTVSTR